MPILADSAKHPDFLYARMYVCDSSPLKLFTKVPGGGDALLLLGCVSGHSNKPIYILSTHSNSGNYKICYSAIHAVGNKLQQFLCIN